MLWNNSENCCYYKESQTVDGKYIIKYSDGFRSHDFKFNKAFDYLQNNDYDKCIILNDDALLLKSSFLTHLANLF